MFRTQSQVFAEDGQPAGVYADIGPEIDTEVQEDTYDPEPDEGITAAEVVP